ncbi:uncharacterized protein LOC102919968 isoform X1 [Peromyscus maniculatus bairdii]|uniref:uncharacterized protein LOC102919968 isoform X1 n=1 Tax=Peromyscus maniculatus bairdii TaxID=230844 RepID=UPI003FCFB6F0
MGLVRKRRRNDKEEDTHLPRHSKRNKKDQAQDPSAIENPKRLLRACYTPSPGADSGLQGGEGCDTGMEFWITCDQGKGHHYDDRLYRDAVLSRKGLSRRAEGTSEACGAGEHRLGTMVFMCALL